MDLSARHAVKPFDSAFCRRKRVREGQTSILGFIRNEEGADRQFDWFVPDKANGPMQAGLSQLNQSIEAFVYCVREAQVNVLIIILGKGGRAKKTLSEFFTLLENAIRHSDLAKSVQRYQLTVEEAIRDLIWQLLRERG